MNKTFIFGHSCPDTDSIASSLVMEYLQNNTKAKLNETAQAFRLGELNKETEFVLNYFKINSPELLEELPEGSDVILIDHNEFAQSAKSIEKSNIRMVVDHHRVCGFQTAEPLYYIAQPVGCTSTILYELFSSNNIEIPREIAGLMLSAIISDTLLFKSPTCTVKDKFVADELAKIANIDVQSYGMEMLKAGTDLSSYSVEELLNIDAKTFEENSSKFTIAQVNTVCIADVLKKKAEIEVAMNASISKNNLSLFIFLITDILDCNSQVIVLGDRLDIIEKGYNVTIEDNMCFLKGVVSRKKQVLPIVTKNA